MLTKRQKQILDFVINFISKYDYSPSLEEIKRHFRLRSVATIHEHIETLRSKGYLKKEENQPRSVSISEEKENTEIPLFGFIAAGEPIEAISNPQPITVPKTMLSKSGLHYALKVKGTSMIDDNIYDGDTVIIKRQETAENGQTVVALINGNEATLKKIYKEKYGFKLQPANSNMKPIFVKDLIIQGKVIGVLPNYEDRTKISSQMINKQLKSDTAIINQLTKLKIQYKKTCNCQTNHINCLTAKEWMRNQVAVWEFSYEKRDTRDKNIHPAVFPIGLPAKCIELFTHKGELVLDPFVGIGTTLLAARDLGRNAVGFDLNKKYIGYIDTRMAQQPLYSDSQQIAICDDSINIFNYLEPSSVALSVTSPPYANMLNRPRKNKSLRGNLRQNQYFNKIQQYSTNSRDLGTMEPKEFARSLAQIYKNFLPIHKPKGHCIINITDLWWENKRIPIHIYVVEEMQKVGYELRNTIIWDRRNLVNGAGIFGWPSNYITLGTTFEYILDFWRPPPK